MSELEVIDAAFKFMSKSAEPAQTPTTVGKGKRKGSEEGVASVDFSAELTQERFEALESKCRTFDPERRIVLLLLTKSKPEMMESLMSNEEVFWKMLGLAVEYGEHLDDLRKLTTTVIARMLLAGESCEAES